ncbi:MAG: AMP-binding protein [Gammaproteobacteria bacterium]|nr:AMP-binding protein [Gammaproteobacteria bacterium]
MSHQDTLFAAIAAHAKIAPEMIALQALHRTPLSYAALVTHINTVVQTLNNAGIGRSDRVAIVMPNSPELASACLSVIAGASAAPLNPDYKQPEYAQIFQRLRPRALILPAATDHPARAAAQSAGIAVLELVSSASAEAGLFTLQAQKSAGKECQSGMNQPEDEALVLQTSGTTSQPKVVPLTQRNLAASARNLIASLELTSADRVLHFLPMFHIGGIVDVLGAPLMAGGTVFCAPSFSAPDFYRDLVTFKPTWTQGVPVMLEEMLSAAADNKAAVAGHCLRLVRSVSAPLPAARMQAFEAAFSVPVIEIYGMTEAAGVITSNPLPPCARKPGSVGVPAGPQVKIVDTEGVEAAAGAIGEVLVAGDNVIAAYEDAPEDNLRVFCDGWLRTGDLGRFDADHYLYLTGRVKDMINRGGEKVTPQEVDEILLQHPQIADAATFAVPHPTLGEDVAALVVLKEGAQLSAQDLSASLRSQLAFFKVPRTIHFAEKVPRGANGKLQRARLTEMYGDLAQAQGERPAFRPPASAVTRLLAGMWSDILKCDDIGLDDDFFDVGGDSLKAASFINALQQKWGETIYVSSVFDAPTLAKYEHYLQLHYPDIVARMTGSAVAVKQSPVGKVTPAMVAQLQSMIARPLERASAPLIKKNPRAIFVLSPPRSGSTLLRAMMAGHPGLFAPPELYLLSYENLADRKRWFSGSHRSQLEGCIRAMMQARNESASASQALMEQLEADACPVPDFYAMLQEWVGEQLLVDKTPAYAVDLSTLQRAEAYFDEPIYVHLLRHPYGMIRSFEEAKLDQLWFPRLVGSDSYSLEAFPFERRQLAEMIWLSLHRNILEFLQDVPAHRQCRLRFEDVVAQPQAAMQSLCSALGIPYEPDMLDPQGDKKQRMTDGIHDVSRMIGDPKFHQHKKIEATVADQWKSAYEYDFLSDETLRLAESLGYTETVASVRGREEIEL